MKGKKLENGFNLSKFKRRSCMLIAPDIGLKIELSSASF